MSNAPTGFGPPPGVSGSELFQRLTQMPRPYRDVKFPRRGIESFVRIVVLTEGELQRCRANAERFTRETLKDMAGGKSAQGAFAADNLGYLEIYRNESAVQVVCMACRDPNAKNADGSPSTASSAYPNVDLARNILTADEFAVLFEQYCRLQADSGPVIASMTSEEMDAWLEVLGEGASSSPLAQLSSELKSDLLMHSARRLWALRTASTSSGSPAGAPTSSPSA